MGFTKLMEQILQSSIMAEDPPTFKVWIALLAACKQDSIALVSPIYLSAICHLPQDVVDFCLEKLSNPDPYSRSVEHEGRRIERVDGGYKILNYLKYREFSYSSDEEAVRKREYRKKVAERDISGHPGTSEDKPGHSASAFCNLSSGSFLRWWEQYPKQVAKQDAEKAYNTAIKEGATHEELLMALKNYCIKLAREGTEEKFIKHPATFLRSERWKDTLTEPEKPKQIGESLSKDKDDAYWAEVRRVKDEGMQGEELINHMTEWKEKQNEQS